MPEWWPSYLFGMGFGAVIWLAGAITYASIPVRTKGDARRMLALLLGWPTLVVWPVLLLIPVAWGGYRFVGYVRKLSAMAFAHD